MPVLHDPILKCLSAFLKPSERRNIEKDRLRRLISRFPLVITTKNIGKLKLELLDYQTPNYQERKMATIKSARGLISICYKKL